VPTFAQFARLSGRAPLVGVVSGRCFAGNAALLGCCDVIIATKDSSIGMGGPAMIEGGGLGVVRPDEVGPVGMQAPNGVIDVVVEDEVEAAATAKRYLSYFQGRIAAGPVPGGPRARVRNCCTLILRLLHCVSGEQHCPGRSPGAGATVPRVGVRS
jgi:acetyl-CoA carboxylase carboxyltransferase component